MTITPERLAEIAQDPKRRGGDGELVEVIRELQSARAALDRAFAVLELYGVPRERAKTIDNGIPVLMTRMEKEAQALRATLASRDATIAGLREALTIPDASTFAEMNNMAVERAWVRGWDYCRSHMQTLLTAALRGDKP